MSSRNDCYSHVFVEGIRWDGFVSAQGKRYHVPEAKSQEPRQKVEGGRCCGGNERAKIQLELLVAPTHRVQRTSGQRNEMNSPNEFHLFVPSQYSSLGSWFRHVCISCQLLCIFLFEEFASLIDKKYDSLSQCLSLRILFENKIVGFVDAGSWICLRANSLLIFYENFRRKLISSRSNQSVDVVFLIFPFSSIYFVDFFIAFSLSLLSPPAPSSFTIMCFHVGFFESIAFWIQCMNLWIITFHSVLLLRDFLISCCCSNVQPNRAFASLASRALTARPLAHVTPYHVVVGIEWYWLVSNVHTNTRETCSFAARARRKGQSDGRLPLCARLSSALCAQFN